MILNFEMRICGVRHLLDLIIIDDRTCGNFGGGCGDGIARFLLNGSDGLGGRSW
jgi:hypothetical protein